MAHGMSDDVQPAAQVSGRSSAEPEARPKPPRKEEPGSALSPPEAHTNEKVADRDQIASAGSLSAVENAHEPLVQGNFAVNLAGAAIKEIIIAVAGKATEEEIQLVSEIENTISTLNGIFSEAASDDCAKATLNKHTEKLYWIAKGGLQIPSEPKVAARLLRNFQNDLLLRHGARIKNDYMRRLGAWAAGFAGAALALYAFLVIAQATSSIATIPVKTTTIGNVVKQFDSFLILWIGAMAGCWLSFGIRNVQLTFPALAHPESDLLQPPTRLIFTGLLAITLGLIFNVGIVQLEIGSLKTEQVSHASVALIIGLFCGIAEQALSSTIGNRATQFIGQVSK